MRPTFLTLFLAVVATAMVTWFVKPNPKTQDPITKVTTKTITLPGDSVPFPVVVKVPVPHDSVVTDTFYKAAPVDTAAILARYFKRYIYQDTIKDSTFLAILREVVTQNSITERSLKVQNLRPMAVTYTSTITSIPSEWYVGPSLSYNGKLGLGVGGIWCNQKRAIGINMDITNRTAGITYLVVIK